MGKTGSTKSKITDMLRHKPATLTDLSNTLELAPSTISQHLDELQSSGVVKKVDQGRKWKYYELSTPGSPKVGSGTGNISRMAISIALSIAVAALAVWLLISQASSTGAAQIYIAPGSNVPVGSTLITVSDAPLSQQYNITDLYLTINGASIESSTGRWYNITIRPKTSDLARLGNLSSLLADVNLEPGRYTKIVLNISKAVATVNGANEILQVPSDRFAAVASYNISRNCTNWIDIDFRLANSIYLTDGGQFVVLPEVNVTESDVYGDIRLNRSMIASSTGKISRVREGMFGERINGTVAPNFTFPEGTEININQTGVLSTTNHSGFNVSVYKVLRHRLDVEVSEENETSIASVH